MSAASEVLNSAPVFPLTSFWRLHYLKYAREARPDVSRRGGTHARTRAPDSPKDANRRPQPNWQNLERQLASRRISERLVLARNPRRTGGVPMLTGLDTARYANLPRFLAPNAVKAGRAS